MDRVNNAKLICGYDYEGNDNLVNEALNSAGAPGARPEGNKLLALVGDGVIALCVKNRCFEMGFSIGTSSHHRLEAGGLT